MPGLFLQASPPLLRFFPFFVIKEEERQVAALKILVIDGQGGNLGRELVKLLLARLPQAKLRAVGTNSAATASMLKAGASEAATGENAVVVGSRWADVIVGPIGVVIADALLGEVTPAMAAAVGSADAQRVLIPMSRCDTQVAGVSELSTAALLEDAAQRILRLAEA